MGLGRRSGFALVALVLLVSHVGGHAALDDVKVISAGGETVAKLAKSIGSGRDRKATQNSINDDDLRPEVNGAKVNQHQWEEIGTSERNGTDLSATDGKPSKFDADVSGFIHTDLKSLHESEALRLKTNKESKDVDSVHGLGSTIEKIGWNETSRVDENVADNEDHAKAEADDPDDDVDHRCDESLSMNCLERDFEKLVDGMSTMDVYNLTDYVQIVKNSTQEEVEDTARGVSIVEKVTRYARNHVLKIKLPTALSSAGESRTFFGALFQENSSFFIGFGLGFLAFGFKKLMLPFIIGMQLVKGVIVALFLPTILGTIGKIVGKSVSTFSQASQSAATQPEESFEFKDNTDIYNDDYMHSQPIGTLPASAMYDQATLATGTKYLGTPGANQRISYGNAISDNYYSRNAMHGATKQQDYKVFHDIPASSLLLTNYDPFYSPLLSRLDAVFSRLGHATEGCREYAICAMYRSPARYAPYSNLVSAQLSRELNELRKPSSDNPDILRFFKYMKSAKDGQDGVQCEDVYTECASRGAASDQNQAMLATYQDINKLVQARKI